MSTDGQTGPDIKPSAANRLRIDYRSPPPRKVNCEIIDSHTHVHNSPHTPTFFEAADLYRIGRIVSMTPLHDLDALAERHGDRLTFIAIPDWKRMKQFGEAFRNQWIDDLKAFRGRGARVCKFWMAPRMRERHGMTIDHVFLRPVVDAALDAAYPLFMIHVADPTVWFAPGGRYADASTYGAKHEQYDQLEWLLEYVAPRTVIAAHMGGNIEEPDFLQRLLDRHANLVLDSSATKWIVREVARKPDAVREFILQNAERILFGSDLVASEKHEGFDHYASRYWAHQMMWETPYRGQSPIEDPDAEDPPRLAGLDLPKDALVRLYQDNALRLGLVG